jgi:hypothetical protein
VGLPDVDALDIRFVRDERSPQPIDFSGGRYMLLAEDTDGFRFGLDLENDRVDMIFLGRFLTERQFINSSLPLFLLALGSYVFNFMEFVSVDPDERLEIGVERLVELIEDRDPPATEDKTYWQMFLYDLAYG